MRPLYSSLMIHFITGGLLFLLAFTLTPKKAQKKLGWKPKTNIEDLIREMMVSDRKEVLNSIKKYK